MVYTDTLFIVGLFVGRFFFEITFR